MRPSPRKREASPHLDPPPQAGEGGRTADGWGLTPRAAHDPTDIYRGDWVDRWLPDWAEPYARLARWDRPIGTWLLLFPGWWGIGLAGPAWPDPVLLLLFGIGAVAMRGAGCTLNDIAGREYDGKVPRPRLHRLPSGRVGIRQAVAFMAMQL